MINIPKGTKDVLPEESYKWHYVEKIARETADLYCLKEIRTPTFEHTELFLRGVGETTDVVNKEMYTFLDKGDRSITLKPEGTAGVARSFIENGLFNGAMPLKMYYITPVFRYENPQKGRLREHHQFGVEICPTCRERYVKNPLRILDCKSEECKALCVDAPKITDYLCDDCKAHFEKLQVLLGDCGVDFEINPYIVRGLDYYTRTVFEFVTTSLGSQGTVCGGGRYDNLIAQLGGTPTPGVGFGMGIERLLMLMEAEGVEISKPETVKLYIATMGEAAYEKAFSIASALRDKGVKTEIDHAGRGVKAQFKYADKIGAENVVTLGENEIQSGVCKIKRMSDGVQTEVRIDDISTYFA